MSLIIIFFFVKRKTAYELRISDWSSDVCSSDLLTNELNPTHTNSYSPNLGPVGPGVDEPHEGLIRFRRGQHRLPAAGEAVRLALFTRLSARPEERRGRKECVRTGRSRVSAYT